MNPQRPLTVALAVAVVAACRPDDQRTDTIDPVEAMQQRENFPPGIAALLDSANEAFRADRFGEALDQYTRMTEQAPDLAAGWFGVYMAHNALGNDSLAGIAMERARSAVPGASLIHPGRADTAR